MLTAKNPSKIVWADMPLEEMALGNMLDVSVTLQAYFKLNPQLKEINTDIYYETLIKPLIPIFADIEYKGLDIDELKLDEIGRILLDQIKIEYDKLKSLHCDSEANLSSNDDIANHLFLEESGLKLFPPLLTKKGKPATSKDCLKTLLDFIDERLQTLK